MILNQTQSHSRWITGTLLVLMVVGNTNCQFLGQTPSPPSASEPEKIQPGLPLTWKLGPNEIQKQCDQAIQSLEKKIDGIITLSPEQRSFENTILAFENSMADFSTESTHLIFYGYVSTDPATREASSECEGKITEYSVGITTRKDLYLAIKNARPSSPTTHPQHPLEQRLIEETLRQFEKNGLKLSDEKLAKMRELKQRLGRLETEFSKNLNEDKSSVSFSEEELTGVPQTILSGFKKTDDGKYMVTTKSTDYTQVSDYASNPETRKRLLLAYENRAAEKNSRLLKEAIVIRQQIAELMGYANWADYQISEKMAKTSPAVTSFLESLSAQLSLKNRADLSRLLAIKKGIDPTANEIHAWDIRYLTNQLKTKELKLDAQKVREYFPAEQVVQGMFQIYSRLLGVRFEEVPQAEVWAPEVKRYSVIDTQTQELIATFYTDFYPREGKYGHAAAFTLRPGRKQAGGYAMPVSAIVSNFNPPSQGKPSLLSHGEVETLFHEFGHIMHQVLTRAPYASMSGTSVARDLVEAPSQMLENWVWNREILASISGHYQDPSKKLPEEMLNQLLAAKNLNVGYSYSRQLVFALFDMALHTTQSEAHPNTVYSEIHQRLMGFAPVEGSNFPAGFGHLMGGYDAGYYGYLWSEVYAADMFSIFEKNGLLDEGTGMRYRRTLLEKGSTVDPFALLEEFLGRKPNSDAFFRQIGI